MKPSDIDRRQFARMTAGAFTAGFTGYASPRFGGTGIEEWDPSRPMVRTSRGLTVQPIFMYRLPVRKEEASWKSWGGIQTRAAVGEEIARITSDVAALRAGADFPVEILPVAGISTVEEASKLKERNADVALVYACTGNSELLRACCGAAPDTLIFVRHRSGPVYYWYEALSVRQLEAGQAGSARSGAGAPHVDDVVVDDYEDIAWRLRSLTGIQNLRGTRVVALGGAWGKYSPDAPQKAREQFGLQIINVSYEEMALRISKARADAGFGAAAGKWTARYLALPRTRLQTGKDFLTNAFLLYGLFKQLMLENEAAAFTIKSCMGTIIPMSKTTACLSLSLLNDEGRMAFCEADFVVIPAGILLYHISGKPVFLHNSTFPHQKMVTCAHCTAPRRMDGKRYEPATILTHYESEYGAAPKVEMPVGQEVTFLDPEFTVGRWLGFKGIVRANPFYAICRSQQDVEIQGDWRKLVREVRDSHWLMCYGDYLREAGYAARKLGLAWDSLSV